MLERLEHGSIELEKAVEWHHTNNTTFKVPYAQLCAEPEILLGCDPRVGVTTQVSVSSTCLLSQDNKTHKHSLA
jgi:hypothetical protein